ncbi:class I SAM-dependent methyltransferase [candidate division WOR-3 bacterium]|nr:class I SAM-dependent methyltransferase [candidate division WOR-3 bacterium]
MKDSMDRFGDRVDSYKKYRPMYPIETVEFIRDKCRVEESWQVADVGSGTGISSSALLKTFGCHVWAVEPNKNMREEAENILSVDPGFHSIDGSAESTGLENGSVNMVTAFQAFHWFDKNKTKNEFRRILKEPHWIVLVWNDRRSCGTVFLEEYEDILRSIPEYLESRHRNVNIGDIYGFMSTAELIYAEFRNLQKLDLEGLKGRFFSSSYTPAQGTEGYRIQLIKLAGLFEKTNINGFIEFLYDTRVFLGRMNGISN